MNAPSKPIITVAVPTCNGGRHLRAALESIERSATPHQLLIVDDRSSDETVDIARQLVGHRAHIEVNSERLGLAGNWNRCVALSQTPLVAVFHQDDVMLATHLQAHVALYQKDPSLGWIASAAEVIDDLGQAVPESIVDRGGLGQSNRCFAAVDGLGALVAANPLRCSGVTINAAAHAEVGGFDPAYRYVVDWDFWFRVALVRPVAWLAEPTVTIRWHPASETHRFADGTFDLDETERFLDLIGLTVGTGFSPGWRRAGNFRLARAYLNRAHVAFKAGNALLARRALRSSLRLAPAQLARDLLGDPRLLAQMIAVFLAPRLIRRSGGEISNSEF